MDEVKLARAYKTRHIRGHHVKDVEIFPFEMVQHKYGLVQDVPLDPILYGRINKDAPTRLRLVYVEPDVALDVPFSREAVDDVGTMRRYDT